MLMLLLLMLLLPLLLRDSSSCRDGRINGSLCGAVHSNAGSACVLFSIPAIATAAFLAVAAAALAACCVFLACWLLLLLWLLSKLHVWQCHCLVVALFVAAAVFTWATGAMIACFAASDKSLINRASSPGV